MFEPPPIPKEKIKTWEEFQKKLQDFAQGHRTTHKRTLQDFTQRPRIRSSQFYSTQKPNIVLRRTSQDFTQKRRIRETVFEEPKKNFKDYLQKIFTDNQDCPNLLIKILDLLLIRTLEYPHVYDFCKDKIPDDYWQIMLSYFELLPQPGLTKFELMRGVPLLVNAFESKEDDEIISNLKIAINKYNSFFPFLLLHDYFYRTQLLNAIQNQQSGVIIHEMYQEITAHGEIHGTPTYLLRANFCFWCAQYYQTVMKDLISAKICYQLAIRHLICADQIKDISQAAINNAFYVYNEDPNSRTVYEKYNFFNLLNLVKEGNVGMLINVIMSTSGLTFPEVDIACSNGKADAEKFRSWINSTEIPEIACCYSPTVASQ